MVGQEPLLGESPAGCGTVGKVKGGSWAVAQPSPPGRWWSQMLLLLTALQPAIFSILANNGSIACSPPFSSKARSQRKSGDGEQLSPPGRSPPSHSMAWRVGMVDEGSFK